MAKWRSTRADTVMQRVEMESSSLVCSKQPPPHCGCLLETLLQTPLQTLLQILLGSSVQERPRSCGGPQW